MKYLDLARNIADFLIEKATSSEGILFKKINITNGRNVTDSLNISELGDYVQNIAYLGILTKENSIINWSKQQIELAIKYAQHPMGIFFHSLEAGGIESPLPNNQYYDLTAADSIIGISDYYFITSRQELLIPLKKFFEGIEQIISECSNLLPSGYRPSDHAFSPVSDPMSVGNLIEILAELYILTQEQFYFELMQKLASPWIDNRFFNENCMFRRENVNLRGVLYSSIVNRFYRFTFMNNRVGFPNYTSRVAKQNTHILFGLLKMSQLCDKELIQVILERWINFVQSHLKHSSGVIYGAFNFRNQKAFRLDVFHTINCIELLISHYLIYGKEHCLITAEEMTWALLNLRNGLGLIPRFPFPSDDKYELQYQIRKEYTDIALDDNIDIVVNMLKLYEITKKEELVFSALDLLECVIKNFRYGLLYTENINSKSLKKDEIVRTKYLGLMIKSLILAAEVQAGHKILEGPNSIISKDR